MTTPAATPLDNTLTAVTNLELQLELFQRAFQKVLVLAGDPGTFTLDERTGMIEVSEKLTAPYPQFILARIAWHHNMLWKEIDLLPQAIRKEAERE